MDDKLAFLSIAVDQRRSVSDLLAANLAAKHTELAECRTDWSVVPGFRAPAGASDPGSDDPEPHRHCPSCPPRARAVSRITAMSLGRSVTAVRQTMSSDTRDGDE